MCGFLEGALVLTRLAEPFRGKPLLALTPKGHVEALAGNPPVVELERPDSRELDEAWPVTRGHLRSIITDQWHYIRCADGREELYDLEADPRELHNVASAADSKAVLQELREALREAASR